MAKHYLVLLTEAQLRALRLSATTRKVAEALDAAEPVTGHQLKAYDYAAGDMINDGNLRDHSGKAFADAAEAARGALVRLRRRFQDSRGG